ncbi:MAG TPA: PRC-barrel domain-containing protein [Gemmatimonadaceae bacterium]|nr:PRC-barrel domain-containing protein [Gemmatimonadaceae bacterium]
MTRFTTRDLREGRHEAGVGPNPDEPRHVFALSELKDWKVGRGDPDVRKWPAYSSNGRLVGKVSDLLVDTEAAEVVFLEIALENGRAVQVPARGVWLVREHKRVVLDGAALREELRALGRDGTPASAFPAPQEAPVRGSGERVVEEVVVRRRIVGDDELRQLVVGDTLDGNGAPESRAGGEGPRRQARGAL